MVAFSVCSKLRFFVFKTPFTRQNVGLSRLKFGSDVVLPLDVLESLHRDTTLKITNKMHYIDYFIIPSRLYMFRAMFSPIIRST